jgi:hypothetical protein
LGSIRRLIHAAEAGPAMSLEELASSDGAEEFNLVTLRRVVRRDFHTLLWALGNSPHVAMLTLRFFQRNFDSILYGADEATAKSPFSWPLLIFAPGILAVRYIWAFYGESVCCCFVRTIHVLQRKSLRSGLNGLRADTDPIAVCFFTATYVLADLAWWAQLLMLVFLPYVRRGTLKLILQRVGMAVISTACYRYFFFSATPHYFTDFSYWAFLALGPFVALASLVFGLDLLALSLKIRVATLVPAPKTPLVFPEPDFDHESVSQLYSLRQQIGKGGFGVVYCGEVSATGLPVAIKELTVEPPTQLKDALKSLALAAIVNDSGVMSRCLAELGSVFVGIDSKYRDALNAAEAELIALLAVRSLGHPSLIRLVRRVRWCEC